MNFTFNHAVKCVFPIYLIIFGLMACSSSPEKEKQRWQDNQQRNQEYQTRYPTMQGVLKADQKVATNMWKAALTVKDAKAQVKAMQEANRYISEIPSQLGSLEAELRTADQKVKELSRVRLSIGQDMARDRKIQSLVTAVDQVQTALRRDPQVEHVATIGYLRNLKTRLSSTVRTARQMLRTFRKQKSKARAKAKANNKAKTNKTKAKTPSKARPAKTTKKAPAKK